MARWQDAIGYVRRREGLGFAEACQQTCSRYVPVVCLGHAPTPPGQAVVDVGGAGYAIAGGELGPAFDLGRLPPTTIADWPALLFDGDLRLDVAIDI